MIHWSWFIFVFVVFPIVKKLWKNMKENKGDYSWDLESPFLVLILVAFVLIWGGIFWW